MEDVKTIGKEYTLFGLLKFVSIPILTQFALSLFQTIDDGLFISRYIGPSALAAFSMGMPVVFLKEGTAMMLAGASNHCSTKMGEGKNDEANSDFTTAVLIAFVTGILFMLGMILFINPILDLLGVTDNLRSYAYPLMLNISFSFPLSFVTTMFSRFYVPAGKPKYLMYTILLNGFCNFFFDWVFIVQLSMGIIGTCYANFAGCLVSCIFGICFYSSKKCEVGFAKPNPNVFPLLVDFCKIGFSSMLTHVALSVNSRINNAVIMGLGPEIYISAFTIVNNIQFVFMGGFFGLNNSVCPIISYAYGEKKKEKLRKIIYQAFEVTFIFAAITITCYYLGYKPLTMLYMTPSSTEELKQLVYTGLKLAPPAFIFFPLVVLIGDIFSALHNSRAAAVITVMENVVFANLVIIIMGKLFKMTGVWLAFAVQEFFALIVAAAVAYINRDRYGYGPSKKATEFEK